MKYNNVIENKLRLLEKKLEEIESWNIDSFEKLKESSLLQNAVERALQVAIEIMIDIIIAKTIMTHVSFVEIINPTDKPVNMAQ